MDEEKLYNSILSQTGGGDRWFEKKTEEWVCNHLLSTYVHNNLHTPFHSISLTNPSHKNSLDIANTSDYEIKKEGEEYIIKNTSLSNAPLLLFLTSQEEVMRGVRIRKEDRERVMVGLLLKNKEYEDVVREEKNKYIRNGSTSNFFSSPNQLFFNTVKIDDDHEYVLFFTDNIPPRIGEMYI